MRHLALAVSAALAFGSFTAQTHAQTKGVSANAIKIGTVTDLSGPLASWGVAATNGIRMRFDEANAAGGIHGRRIELIVEDMQYQIPNAIRAANKLMTSDQVFAFIATLGTPPNNAVMKSVLDAGFPYLFPLSAGLTMSEPPHPLRLPFLLNDRDTMRGAVRFFADKGVKRICYQGMANDYGAEVEAGVKSAAEKLGLTITASGKHKPTETEFTAAVLSLRNSGCQALFLGTVARDATQIYTAVRSAGWDIPVVSALGALVPPVAENTAMEGFYTAAPFYIIDFKAMRATRPQVADWAERYKARFNVDPSPQAVIGYTMADVTVGGLQQAGRDLNVKSLMAAFPAIGVYKDPFGGPDVKLANAKHFGAEYSVLSQVKGGRWTVVAPQLPF
jgi:branched-chain amino acid transport system substrate-binding protein